MEVRKASGSRLTSGAVVTKCGAWPRARARTFTASATATPAYAGRGGATADFVFLACDTCLRREGRGYGRQAATPYLDTRPLLTAGKPEIREYKAMFVLNDEEIGNFSHEL